MLIIYKIEYADIRKIKGVLTRKGIFSETTCLCTYVPNFKFLAQF